MTTTGQLGTPASQLGAIVLGEGVASGGGGGSGGSGGHRRRWHIPIIDNRMHDDEIALLLLEAEDGY